MTINLDESKFTYKVLINQVNENGESIHCGLSLHANKKSALKKIQRLGGKNILPFAISENNDTDEPDYLYTDKYEFTETSEGMPFNAVLVLVYAPITDSNRHLIKQWVDSNKSEIQTNF